MIPRKIITALPFLLAACAPSTIQGLKDDPAGVLNFETDQKYQSVYRQILTRARECWQQGASLATAQIDVQGDLFADIQRGSITVAARGPAGTDMYLTTDIIALEENKTKVTTWYALRGSRPRAMAIELWVKQNSPECLDRSALNPEFQANP